MRVKVTKSAISGSINAPTSKSAMQRYIAGALLAEGITRIFSPTFCDDSKAALEIAKSLGAEIETSEEFVTVKGGFNPRQNKIFCGESGLATRMFTPVAAIYPGEMTIDGKGSLLKRPMSMMENPLKELGVGISTSSGFLPVKIKGPLKGGNVIVDGSISSQFITGLLIALPIVQNDSVIFVNNLVSKPYIDLTIRILKEFGIEIVNYSYEKFDIKGWQKYRSGDFTVDGDWSGAAFMLVAAAIGGEVEVRNLSLDSAQADKSIFNVIKLAGADITTSGDSILVSGRNLQAFRFDISDCPDLAPPLAVLALACKGKSIITGTGRLASKESDRGRILEATLSSLGGRIKSYGDRIEIDGGLTLAGGIASASNDHRIAMALASASLLCNEPVIINGMECIDKSYPQFIDDFSKIGADIKLL